MRMYLPFGDWSDDGHGKWDKLLIDAPSMEYLLNAQKKIKAIYGEHFFNGMADEYEEPHFSEDVWQALKDSNYPIERMWKLKIGMIGLTVIPLMRCLQQTNVRP